MLSKENLESALSDLGATITENADKTFTVTINETGNIYIISSAGKMLKYQFKGEEMKDEPEEIEDDSYVEPTEEVTE